MLAHVLVLTSIYRPLSLLLEDIDAYVVYTLQDVRTYLALSCLIPNYLEWAS